MFETTKQMFRSLYESKRVLHETDGIPLEYGSINILFATVIAGIIALAIALLTGASWLNLPILVMLSFGLGILSWLVGGTVMWFIGNLLGGTADWARYMAAISYPLAGGIIASAIVTPIPVIGAILALAVTVVVFIAYVFITEETNNISVGKAFVAVLAPTIIVLIAVSLLGVGALAGYGTASILPSML